MNIKNCCNRKCRRFGVRLGFLPTRCHPDEGTVGSHLNEGLTQGGGVAVLQCVLEVVVRDGQSIEHLLQSRKNTHTQNTTNKKTQNPSSRSHHERNPNAVGSYFFRGCHMTIHPTPLPELGNTHPSVPAVQPNARTKTKQRLLVGKNYIDIIVTRYSPESTPQ